MILEEFDKNKNAIINPEDWIKKIKNMPETVVSFFESQLLHDFLKKYKHKIIGKTGGATKTHYVYKINYKGKPIAIVQAGIGAPYCTMLFEEVIAMGAKNILLFGSCGTLKDINECSIIIPTRAVRDEGTSYHYLPASDEIEIEKKYQKKLADFFDKLNIKYEIGKTWTVDAIYRETKEKIKKRIAQGCISVDMECSAMAALCEFRKINFAQFFYSCDNLSNEDWDPRCLSNDIKAGKDAFLPLALECAQNLFEK